MKIWDDIIDINVPEGFEEATIGEKRKVYGIGKKMPDKMLVDRNQHIVLSMFQQEIEQEDVKDEKSIVQAINYAYSRTVPGYKCIGMFKKNVNGKEIYVIQYTSYTIDDTLYTIAAIVRIQGKLCILNCVCSNSKVPEWHPRFRSIIESIK